MAASLRLPARCEAPPCRGARRALRRHAPRAALAVDAASSSAAPPARVAIVGAGVGGLSLAVALRKLCPATREVTVFETEEDLRAERGAAFNLNGGAAVLTDLGLGPALARIANPMARVLGRTVGGATLLDVSIAAALRGHEAALVRNGRSCCVTVLRSALQAALLDAATAPGGGGAAATVCAGAPVAGVRLLDGGKGGASLELSDGTVTPPFDLVVGADGLRSRVRAAVVGAAAPAAPSYAGIRIAFGVVPRAAASADGLRPAPSEVHQWFAPGAYALCFSAGAGAHAADAADAGAHCLALCWQDASPAAENPNWDASAVQAATLARLAAGGFPAEVSALASAATRFFEIGVAFHQPLPEGTWAHPSGRMVLLGDACHAMPPFLGQGANQAIQDAASLAGRLARVGAAGDAGAPTSLAAALAGYEAARRAPTSALQVSSRAIGMLDTLPAPWHPLRDAALWFAGTSGIAGAVFINGALPRL